MPQKIGVQAILDTADFLGGLRQYLGGLNQGEQATDKFAKHAEGPASAGLMAFQQIAIGALRKVGEVAVEAMGKAVQAVGTLVTNILSGAAESETAWARLGAVIAAGGDQVDITAEDAQNLAMANRDLFQGNDELVASVIQVGLSMGTVSKDQMPTFLQQVADLAAVTGTDAPSAARLFARAYEDPIGALKAFRAQNIMVDAATKETMENLIKQGDTAGAAALLMERVGEATAGAAETMAQTTEGKLAIMKEHFADFGEGIGAAWLTALAPALDQAGPLLEELGGVLTDIFASETFTGVLMDLVGLVSDLGAGLVDFLQSPAVKEGIAAISAGLEDVIDFIRGGDVGDSKLFAFLKRMGEWWDKHGPALQQVAEETFGKIGESVGALAEKVGPFVDDVMERLATWFEENGPLIETFAAAAGVAFANVVDAITTAWDVIEPLLGGLLDLILGIFKVAMQVATGDWEGAWETIKGTAQAVWEAIKLAISEFADWIAGWFGTTWQGIKDTWAANWENLKLIVALVWDRIKLTLATKAAEILLAIINWLLGIKTSMQTKWQEITDAVKTAIEGMRDAIRAKIASLVLAGTELIHGFWIGIRDRVNKLLSDLRVKLKEVTDLVKKIFGMKSPSTVFMELGRLTMEGFAIGIDQATGRAVRSMQAATTMVMAPAAAAVSGASSYRETNYNFDFDANYARTQSPVTVRDDVQALLAGLRR